METFGQMSCLLLVSMWSVLHSVPTPQWEEFPLTQSDIRLIKVGAGVPITTTTINQTCLLTPSSETGPDASCTWRTFQDCKRIPTIISVPVYSPWCTEGGRDAHLTKCRESIVTVPIVHSVQVCTPTGTPDCRGPCYNCEQYCEPAEQTWCEVSHSISTLVTDKRECREVEGAECEEVLLRVEKDVVKSNDNCYEKAVELCGPVNCKFVNVTKECHEKNNTMQVELRERECMVCEPTLAEKVKVEQVCEEILTNDCESDPLNRTWEKYCGKEETNLVKKFQFDDIEEPRSLNNPEKDKFSVEDLIHQSLGPVNNLVFETLKQINVEDIDSSTPIIITKNPEETSTEDLSGILKLLELEKQAVKEEIFALEESQSNPTTINVNVQFDPSSADFSREPKSNVYFDQIRNTVNKKTELEKDLSATSNNPSESSPPSLTEVLDKQLQSQFLPTSTEITKNINKSTPETLEVTAISRKSTKIEDPTIERYISTTEPQITLTTTIPGEKIEDPKTITTKSKESSLTRKKLTPAEFLRLCFTSHTGCDFSQNEIESNSNNIADTEVVKTTTPATTTVIPIIRHSEKDIQEKLKQRVKLCFFSGLCSDTDLEEQVTSRGPTTAATTERLTSTRNPRAREIQRRVQERARACFFDGKCN